MDPQKYEFQSDFAKRYFGRGLAEGLTKGRAEGKAAGRAEGKFEGKAEGKAELLVKQLGARFGPLPRAAHEQLRAATLDDLDVFAERVLTAASLDDVFMPTSAPRRRRTTAGKPNARKR